MADSLSSSPSSSAAVTASEGSESDTQDDPNTNPRKPGISDLSKVVFSNPKLGSSLSDFLEKLAPWKGIMPVDLVEHMKFLEKTAAEMRQTAQTVKPRRIRFTYTVLRLTMEDWQTNAPFVARDPVPIILAYTKSDKFDSASDKQPSLPVLPGDMPKGKLYEDDKLLQRVQLNSFFLSNELSTITGISMRYSPIFLAPPFKLLLEYVPQIEQRWAHLKDQLENMQTEPQHPKTKSTAEDSSHRKRINVSENEPNIETSGRSNKHHEDNVAQEMKLTILTERVSQLKCLLDFIQTEPELQRLLSLRAQVAAGSLEMITFPDVWLLFRPGDLIVSKFTDHWQLLKVYATTGGQIQRMARGRQPNASGADPHRGGKSARAGGTITMEEDETERLWREGNFGIGSLTPLKVDCYRLDFIGDGLRTTDAMYKIKPFHGDMKITDLPIYPARFQPDTANFLRGIEDRGLKFLMSPGHKYYKGPSARLNPMDKVREIDGDVYVENSRNGHDFDRGHLMLPTSASFVMSRAEVSESQEVVNNALRRLTGNEVDTKLSENFMAENRFNLDAKSVEEAKESIDSLRLLPWVVHAYVFRLRLWEDLDIDLLQEIDRRPEARDLSFNELVIPDKTRTLLVSLVEDHASKVKGHWDPKTMADTERSQRPQVDLVRGKGQGLIILLHGPPGSGKTSTAETIAAYTQRPLYSITCGDLGLTATEVEQHLSDHTRRAENWGCVLLLDEADVFLMQRNWQDMDRNALVSVFLRELEYYSGILFLTTNRPGVIDEAFLSRIHMAFHYPAIDLPSTRMMWNNIMDRIERDNKSSGTEVAITFKREQLLRFAERDFLRRERQGKPWNGRQIRNAFNTAIGLGRYQRFQMLNENGITLEEAAASGNKKLMEIKLTKTNFQDIATAARSFEDYIQDLRGGDSEIARLTKVRDDHWGSEGPVAVKDYSNIRNTTLLGAGVPSRSSVAEVSSTVRDPAHSGVQASRVTPLAGRHDGDISEDSDGSSSDDD